MSKVNNIIQRKNGRLHIFQRMDKYKGKLKSKNYYGRTYVDGADKIISSKTSNKKLAITVLEKWFDEINFKKKHNIPIHDNTFKDCLKEYLKSLDDNVSLSPTSKKGIKNRFNVIQNCKSLLDLRVRTIKVEDINKTFLKWRLDKAKSQKKSLRGATLKGDLTVIGGFMTWCYRNGFRDKRLENIALLLSKKLRHQRTSRVYFTKDEYNHLLNVSRKRVKNGRSNRIRFDRERLHQFIIFMVGTGLRVDECLGLEFEDITFVDRNKSLKAIRNESNLVEDNRYCLKINVPQSKTNSRETYSTASAYFALQRLMKLYKETGMGKIDGNIFQVSSFREGLNSLLQEANLKTKKIGDRIVKRDSKSLRNTFIQFMLDKGVSSNLIAKLCGTSTTMIDKFYTANTAVESMLDVILQTGRTKLKAVS